MKRQQSQSKQSQSSSQFVTIRTEKSINSQILKQPKSNREQKSSCWSQMIHGIVRPPIANYQDYQLGQPRINLPLNRYTRQDVQLTHDGKTLVVTLYIADASTIFPTPYIILYMHGNSSSKLEATGLIRNIPPGVSLAAFDFMGCGKNDQISTISLGLRQAEQSKTVAKYLEERKYKVILWGRSMGAATALLYGQSEFIVADSSFKSFKSLCKQVAKEHSGYVPNFMVSCIFPCVFRKIKWDVQRQAKYDIEDLNVKQALKKLNPETVVIFMSAKNDDLINKRNSEKLLKFCPSKTKELIMFQGNHNTKRPESVIKIVMDKIQKFVLSKQPKKCSSITTAQS